MVSLAALVAVMLLASPLQAAPLADGESQARAATRAFSEALGRGLGPSTLLTLRDLAGHDHPVSVDMLLDVLTEGSPCLRPTARRVLAGYQRPDSVARLLDKGLDHRTPSVRAQVVEVLASGRPPDVDWVTAVASKLYDPHPDVRAAAVQGVGRARDVTYLSQVVEAVSDDAERVRAAAAGAVVRLAQRRALPMLDVLSDDPAWRVRLAVIRALRELKTRGGVELLVEMLDQERGRLLEDINLALVRLTGRNYNTNAEAWTAFLDQAPDDFLAEGDARATEFLGGATQTVAKYYGLSTLSTRFVMVTDLSTSMDHKDPGRYRDSKGTSRLDVTRRELSKLVEGLDVEVAINLITFSDDVDTWRGALVPLSDRNRKAALKEVASYRTISGTNVFSALQHVFDLAEGTIDDLDAADASPDTVFMLTDGAPSVGPLRDIELLLEYVAERNRTAELRFHCVVLTKDRLAESFLVELASATGGQSVQPLR
jgi:hypothetical protein